MNGIALAVSMSLGLITILFAILKSTSSLRAEVKTEFGDLRAEVKSEVGAMQSEIKGLRSDLKSESEGLHSGLIRAEADSRGGFLRLEARIEKGFGEARQDHRDLRGRIDRITDNLGLRGLRLSEEA